MIDALGLEAVTLIFILGLRHGLDPDHIAVIDSLTLRASEQRPGFAPWTGTCFAIGHSLSVAAVAVIVALFSARLDAPGWVGGAVEWLVIALLVLVGSLNLRALTAAGEYRPVGWRSGLIPARLSRSASPAAVIGVGMVFGLVFDTATQAAAWGTVASANGGITGALILAGAFAAGMILIDTLDSQVVARLLRQGAQSARFRVHRRAAGWLIVALAFGTAALAILGQIGAAADVPDNGMTLIGAGATILIVALLAWRREGSLLGNSRR